MLQSTTDEQLVQIQTLQQSVQDYKSLKEELVADSTNKKEEYEKAIQGLEHQLNEQRTCVSSLEQAKEEQRLAFESLLDEQKALLIKQVFILFYFNYISNSLVNLTPLLNSKSSKHSQQR